MYFGIRIHIEAGVFPMITEKSYIDKQEHQFNIKRVLIVCCIPKYMYRIMKKPLRK
jgi:hypothetical protein